MASIEIPEFTWALTVIFGVLTAWWFLTGQREHSKEIEQHYINVASAFMDELTDSEIVVDQMTLLLFEDVDPMEGINRSPEKDLMICNLVGRWRGLIEQSKTNRDLDQRIKDASRLAESSINSINSFAELVDCGLLFPRRFFHNQPNRVRELLSAISILEPYIWYQAIVNGRGRWGLRSLEIAHILRYIERDLPRNKSRTSAFRYFALGWFTPKTINRRSKIRQSHQLIEFKDSFISHGFVERGPSISW